jgi:hypothetical protein
MYTLCVAIDPDQSYSLAAPALSPRALTSNGYSQPATVAATTATTATTATPQSRTTTTVTTDVDDFEWMLLQHEMPQTTQMQSVLLLHQHEQENAASDDANLETGADAHVPRGSGADSDSEHSEQDVFVDTDVDIAGHVDLDTAAEANAVVDVDVNAADVFDEFVPATPETQAEDTVRDAGANAAADEDTVSLEAETEAKAEAEASDESESKQPNTPATLPPDWLDDSPVSTHDEQHETADARSEEHALAPAQEGFDAAAAVVSDGSDSDGFLVEFDDDGHRMNVGALESEPEEDKDEDEDGKVGNSVETTDYELVHPFHAPDAGAMDERSTSNTSSSLSVAPMTPVAPASYIPGIGCDSDDMEMDLDVDAILEAEEAMLSYDQEAMASYDRHLQAAHAQCQQLEGQQPARIVTPSTLSTSSTPASFIQSPAQFTATSATASMPVTMSPYPVRSLAASFPRTQRPPTSHMPPLIETDSHPDEDPDKETEIELEMQMEVLAYEAASAVASRVHVMATPTTILSNHHFTSPAIVTPMPPSHRRPHIPATTMVEATPMFGAQPQQPDQQLSIQQRLEFGTPAPVSRSVCQSQQQHQSPRSSGSPFSGLVRTPPGSGSGSASAARTQSPQSASQPVLSTSPGSRLTSNSPVSSMRETSLTQMWRQPGKSSLLQFTPAMQAQAQAQLLAQSPMSFQIPAHVSPLRSQPRSPPQPDSPPQVPGVGMLTPTSTQQQQHHLPATASTSPRSAHRSTTTYDSPFAPHASMATAFPNAAVSTMSPPQARVPSQQLLQPPHASQQYPTQHPHVLSQATGTVPYQSQPTSQAKLTPSPHHLTSPVPTTTTTASSQSHSSGSFPSLSPSPSTAVDVPKMTSTPPLSTIRETESARALTRYLPPELAASYQEHGRIKELYTWQMECINTEGVLGGRNLVYCAPTRWLYAILHPSHVFTGHVHVLVLGVLYDAGCVI